MDFLRKIDRSKYADPTIPEYPDAYLFIHCLNYGSVVGSVVGVYGVTPIYKYIRKVPMAKAWLTVTPLAFIGGLAFGGAAYYYKYNNGDLTADGVDDRAYRISKNEKVQVMDKYFVLGGLGGAFLGGVLARASLFGTIAAYSTGSTLGLGYYIAEKFGAVDKTKALIDQYLK